MQLPAWSALQAQRRCAGPESSKRTAQTASFNANERRARLAIVSARQLQGGVVVGLALASALAGPACGDDDDAPEIELASEQARVAITLAPFGLSVRDGAGREVLRT